MMCPFALVTLRLTPLSGGACGGCVARANEEHFCVACAGHLNVFYIGDRVRQPNQLNGKSANLNHVVTSKIYPRATSPDDIPEGDILMVIDCDHMCKPELFNKMGPCMRDPDVAVTLVPQWFHNLVLPGACPPPPSPTQCA